MRKVALLALLLFSCGGGGGGGSSLYTVTGKVVASSGVSGLKVCENGTENCVLTGEGGYFELTTPRQKPALAFFVDGLKLGTYTPSVSGETITPFKIAGSAEKGDVLARLLHAFNADTYSNLSRIDLSGVEVTLYPEGSVEELLDAGKGFSLSFAYNRTEYSLSYKPSSGKLELCTGGSCSGVFYRKWLVLIYAGGDNDLSPYIEKDVKELSSLTYPPALKVIMLADTKGSAGAKVYATNETSGNFTVYTTTEEPDTGSAQTLADFVESYMRLFPARRTALVLWNHGDGWRNRIAGEDETSNSYLFMFKVDKALNQVEGHGYTIDFIGFDECLMGMLEVLYTATRHSGVAVASETYEPAEGWNYKGLMERLIANPDASAYTFGRYVVDSYRDAYSGYESALTMVVVKKEDIDFITENLNTIAGQLTPSTNATYHRARASALALPGKAEYVDLHSFVAGLQQSTAEQIKSRIESLYRFTANTNLKGISIYFPATGQSLSQCYSLTRDSPGTCYRESNYYNPFADTQWKELLNRFY